MDTVINSKETLMDKLFLQEELKKRGEKLTIAERIIRVEILLEGHLQHHEKLSKFLLYPLLVGMGVSIVLSLLTLIVTHGGFSLHNLPAVIIK